MNSASKPSVSSYPHCEHVDSRDGSSGFPGSNWYCTVPRVGALLGLLNQCMCYPQQEVLSRRMILEPSCKIKPTVYFLRQEGFYVPSVEKIILRRKRTENTVT